MARLPRYRAPGFPQHVTQRGNNKSVVFGSNADRRFFLDCLGRACDEYDCLVHAYVLMTNHVHLLVTPSTASAIGAVMQSVGRRYVRRFNDRYGRTGTLWEGRFKSTLVETDRYMLACYRYIELNPVRGGLTDDASRYPWSSYRANALGAYDRLVTPHECYEALASNAGERQRMYREICGGVLLDETLREIRDATQRGWVLGNRRFREEVATLLARRTEPATRGRRPRKKDEIRL